VPLRISDENEHVWVRQRIVGYELSLLSRGEYERCRTHFAECAACRKALEEFRQAGPSAVLSDGHVPSALIARWDRVNAELGGLERQMIRRHLETCSQCRQDLEQLGFSPELPAYAAAAVAKPSQLQDQPRRLGPWFAGAWAACATAILLWVLLQPGPVPGRRGSMTAAPTVRLGTVRGDSSPAIRITPNTPTVVFGLQDLEELPPASTVRVVLISPAGETMLEESFITTEVMPPNGLVVHIGTEPWERGIYILKLTGSPAGAEAPMSAEYRLDVSRE